MLAIGPRCGYLEEMLVLHVHDRWSVLGGADWHLVSLLDAWPDHIHTGLLCGRSDGSVEDVVRLSGFRNHHRLHIIKHLDKRASFAREQQTGDQVRSLMDDLKPDLIHVHNILHPHLLDVLQDAAPAIITVQDHRYFCPGRGKVKPGGALCCQPMGLGCAPCFADEDYFLKTLALTRARLASLKKFRAIIVLSHYMKGELAAAGIDPGRIRVVPPFAHGLEERTGPAAFGRTILFAGRVVWAKGITDLIQAMEMVDQRARLVVAGHGPLTGAAREQARKLKLASRVEFRGWTPHHRMADLYHTARLVVCPSRWQEPFGISGLEASASGRPVIAYDVGGIRDWLEDGRTGIIVPPGNILALAAGINVLWRDPRMASQLGAQGRLAARRFDRHTLMTSLLQCYGAVTADPDLDC